eukprot:m.125647 g.125647  ORF g.125647 m.125647 type:complete len:81 (+) comp17334_c0_seq2:434-676(+)
MGYCEDKLDPEMVASTVPFFVLKNLVVLNNHHQPKSIPRCHAGTSSGKYYQPDFAQMHLGIHWHKPRETDAARNMVCTTS